MEDDLMEMRFGKISVRENLQRTVEAGKLTVLPDGNYVLSERKKPPSFLLVKPVRKMDCPFLNDFVFAHAYAKKTVPFGCSNCYKVKIMPKNFRGLIALREVLESSPYHSKCGSDFYNPLFRDIYAGFLYLEGLAQARAACLDMRTRCNNHPELGSAAITIKRGCSHMEAVCGPSDHWQFRAGMQELEAYLQARVQLKQSPVEPYPVRKLKSLAIWIQLAYNIRDDSYLTFTNGIPLRKPCVSYSAEAPVNENIAAIE